MDPFKPATNHANMLANMLVNMLANMLVWFVIP